jgi:hypothetical protein
MPTTDPFQAPLPPSERRPEASQQTRPGRSRVRAVTITLAATAAVGTAALVVDLGASHASATTASSSTSTSSTTGSSSTGLSSTSGPASTSGSSTVQASSGGS